MNIAMLLYDNITALDLVGPYEVFRLLPGARILTVAKRPGLVRTDAGLHLLNAEHALADMPEPDVLFVPGSSDNAHVLRDSETLAWVHGAHETSKWTVSVCTGSLILGAAGLLQGVRANTHWGYRDVLASFGAEVTGDRVVREGKIVTGAGVSAGIDLALTLAALEFGDAVAQGIQLALEYDPQPPFNAGSTESAPPEVVRAVAASMSARMKS